MKFLEGWVSLSWRNSLCTHLHERYLNQTMYYKLNVLDRTVDNPCVWGKEREKKIDAIAYLFCCRDQRITTDVDRFTQTFRSMITNLVSSPLMILYYTYMTYRFLGILGPLSVRSWFFFSFFLFSKLTLQKKLFVYFVIGSIISRFFMSPLVPIVELQEKLEGDYRFVHTAVRSFAESVAFYRVCYLIPFNWSLFYCSYLKLTSLRERLKNVLR